MLGVAFSKFENGQIFHATFVDVAWCYSRLARFVPTMLRLGMRTSSIFKSQHVATRCNRVGKRMQHVVSNNVGICWVQMLRSFGQSLQMLGQQCWDVLRWDIAIVWSGLKRDFFTKSDHLCSRYLGMIFSSKCDHLCLRYLKVIFSSKWDHLCLRYVGAIFQLSGAICALRY